MIGIFIPIRMLYDRRGYGISQFIKGLEKHGETYFIANLYGKYIPCDISITHSGIKAKPKGLANKQVMINTKMFL